MNRMQLNKSRFLAVRMLTVALTFISCAGLAPANNQEPIRLEFRLAEREPADGLEEASVEESNEKIYLHKEAIITNRDVIEARATRSEQSWEISIAFSKEGAVRMAQATAQHIGKPMAILINGKVVSAPRVNSTVSDRAAIFGSFTKEQAEKLASEIKGG